LRSRVLTHTTINNTTVYLRDSNNTKRVSENKSDTFFESYTKKGNCSVAIRAENDRVNLVKMTKMNKTLDKET